MTSIGHIKQENFSPEGNNISLENSDQSETKRKSILALDILFVLLIAIPSGWFIYYLSEPSTLPIKQVNIEGKFNHLSTTYLKEIIRDKVKGNFFNINVELIRKYLMQEPWVKDVSVQRVWPGELRLIVQEQSVSASWNDKALLNDAGELFVPRDFVYQDDIPALFGPEGTERTVLEKYREWVHLFAPLKISIDQLVLSDRRSWSMVIDRDININLGRLFTEQRIARLINLFQEGLGELLNDIEYIDMRYANGFVISWKKQVVNLPENE